MTQTITVKEFDRIAPLDEKQAGLLENFILANPPSADSPTEILGMKVKKGAGKIFTAKNYVGIITLRDGTTIEILPKIYNGTKENAAESEREAKGVLLKMLKSLQNFPSKKVQSANLLTSKLPLFEIFIGLFLEETFAIVKKGLKAGYRAVEGNEPYIKGRLLFNEHLKRNAFHGERFFVCHDTFDTDQAENRILKSTLLYLNGVSKSLKNRQHIQTLLSVFENVPPSRDYDGDFSQIVRERKNAYYQTALSWSKVFLKKNAFTAFAGKEYATALLFPMNVLFESYVYKKLRQHCGGGYEVSRQDRGYYLFDTPKTFALRPDVVIRGREGCYIFDTKWKILTGDKGTNYGISQADMYQMYAYFKEYTSKGEHPRSVTLLYPQGVLLEGLQYENVAGDLTVNVAFVDLLDVDNSIKRIVENLRRKVC